jgi:beta-xylosidase
MTSAAQAATYTNPVLYEDFADNDIWMGPNNTFYYSSSNMHFDPGAPILRSYDLVNWEFVGHSVPSIGAFGSQYNLTGGQQAYRQGTWASTLRYRMSNNKWYWIGCVGFWQNYIVRFAKFSLIT